MDVYDSALHFRRRVSNHGFRPLSRQKRTTRASKKRRNSHEGPIDIPTIKLVQQGVGVQQGTITNREIFGCYRRPSDFTLTCIGYMIGIHNFFRLPHLCYKFGGVFIIAFTILLVIIGAPVIFLEFTIGQYYSVGVREAFGEMAPMLSGTSLILTWNSLITCVMYTTISTWLRIYSGVSTSCLKPWEHCGTRNYYNTEYCYTGALDDNCNDLRHDQNLPPGTPLDFVDPSTLIDGGDINVFFNYQCVSLSKFCEIHGWQMSSKPSHKTCYDPVSKKTHSIFTRRYHSATEYFYGAVSGMERVMEELKRNLTKTFPPGLTKKEIRERLAAEPYTKRYWTKEMQQFQPDKESSSGHDLKIFAVTTWVIFGVLLFEGLLSMTVFTYIINGIPFLILIYMTFEAVSFENSIKGIQALIYGKDISSIWNLEMWSEAAIQVIITTGIGNGVLISLSTFNRLHHGFLFDTLFTILLNMVTSICATLIAFSTIGHYITEYQIRVNFFEFIDIESNTSSIEFGYIVYTHFLTFISEKRTMILLFFFMMTSFTTDSCLRMIQNLLDTLISIFPRLRPHTTVTLIGICFFGLLVGVPLTKSGGIIFYIDYEYNLIQFIFPAILFMQVASTCWIYRTRRILDNAELMEVVHNRYLIWYFWLCLHILTPVLVGATLILNIYNYKAVRFNTRIESVANINKLKSFTIIFLSMPFVLWILGILDQILQLDDLKNWKVIFLSHEDKHLHVHHHLLSEGHQVNQLDFIVNHRALINTEEEEHMKEMEQARLDKHSNTGKGSIGGKTGDNKPSKKRERKPEVKYTEPPRKEAKELNKEILKVIFKRDRKTGKIQLNKEIVERIMFCRDTKGNLKFRKDVLRKTLFRLKENGKLKINKRHLGKIMLTNEKEGKIYIRKETIVNILMQTNDKGKIRLNKYLLRCLKTKKLEAMEDKLHYITGLIFTIPGAQGRSRMRTTILKLLIQRKSEDGTFFIPKKLLSTILLGRKFYTGHTFTKKNAIRNLLCNKPKDDDGHLTFKRNQLGKLLFYTHPTGLKLTNYCIRTVILKENQHGNVVGDRHITKIRKFLVKAGADVKLWSDSPLFKKIKKTPNGFILGKDLVHKVRLRKLSGEKYVISKHLLKKIKRKGNLNLGKHTTTKLKLAKYPFDKFLAFNDAFGRLKRDITGGLKLRKMIAVLRNLRKVYRREHRHSSFMRDHNIVDHRTKMDIWVEKIFKHFEEWPGRLDQHIVDTDGSNDSEDSNDYRRVHKTRLNHMERKELINELNIIS